MPLLQRLSNAGFLGRRVVVSHRSLDPSKVELGREVEPGAAGIGFVQGLDHRFEVRSRHLVRIERVGRGV